MSFVTSLLSDDSKIFVRTMLISIANIDLLQRKFKVKISILDRLYLRVLDFFYCYFWLNTWKIMTIQLISILKIVLVFVNHLIIFIYLIKILTNFK